MMSKRKILSKDHKLGAEVWNVVLVRNVPSFLRRILPFLFLYHEVEIKETKSSQIVAGKNVEFLTQKRKIEGLLLDPGGVAKIEKVEGRPLYIPPYKL